MRACASLNDAQPDNIQYLFLNQTFDFDWTHLFLVFTSMLPQIPENSRETIKSKFWLDVKQHFNYDLLLFHADLSDFINGTRPIHHREAWIRSLLYDYMSCLSLFIYIVFIFFLKDNKSPGSACILHLDLGLRCSGRVIFAKHRFVKILFEKLVLQLLLTD